MANYDTLKATIDAYIRANGVKAITGPVLNGVLRAMVDSVSGGLLFKGIATPAGDPGSPDQNVFFLATDSGTYTNYGGAVLDGKHAAFFVWAGSWTAYLTGIPTDASLPTRVSELANDAGYITAESLADFYTKAETDALLAGKQDGLVSGENIKTINGESLLGSGDITIQGGGSEPYFIRGTIDFNQDPPAVTITSGTYAEALAAYNAGTPVYAALTEGNGAVNIYPLAQVISPFLVFIGIGADSVLAVGLQSDGTVMAVNSALVHPSDLAPVATSGDYNDLTNKPTIPAAQVQSDWNEADNTDPAYIKNKPTIPGPEVFFAEYGVTTAAEIDAAISAGKSVLCFYNGRFYTLGTDGLSSNYIGFFSAGSNVLYILSLNRTNNSWAASQNTLQSVSDRVSTISGNESSTSKYPNTKAMADAIGKMGVISQTQTWRTASDGAYEYTMSNPVRGLIPQANIDLFESVGAVFNASSGYFELNGLTDLSYGEMRAVYGAIPNNPITGSTVKGWAPGANQLKDAIAIRTTPVTIFSTGERNQPPFTWNQQIEVVKFAKDLLGDSFRVLNCVGASTSFYGCNKLRAVYDIINAGAGSALGFGYCSSLETIFISGLKFNFGIEQSPRLTAASVAYMVEKAGTAAFTITLHPTAYARATADPAVQAALAAHTNVTLASA